MALPHRPVTAAVSRLAALVPDRAVTAAISGSYPRFEPELRHLDEFCPRRGTALDVGAWYGPWSRALAARMDTVIAFEPNPAVADVLADTVPANVTVLRAAATDQAGHADLRVPGSGLGTEGVASLRADAHPDGNPVRVATTTIDQLALAEVGFIKLDVEGWELAALRGARRTLAEHRPVLLIELEYRHGPVDEVLDYLAGFGYRGEILLDGCWRALAGFDLRDHQRRVWPATGGRGYLRTVLFGGPRYVNNVLFRSP